MDEYTGGVDLGLSRDLTLRLNVVRKLDWGGSKELDLAQPFEAFTDVRTGVDPGRDNVVGTADDGVVEVWSVPRTYPTFGQVIRLTTNTAPGEGEDQYWAFESDGQQALLNGLVAARLVFDRPPRRAATSTRAIRTKRAIRSRAAAT